MSYKQAEEKYADGDYPDCVKLCNKIINNKKVKTIKKAKALCLLSSAYLKIGEFNEALKHAKKAYELSRSLDTCEKLVSIYAASEKCEEGLSAAEEGLKLHPNSYALLQLRACFKLYHSGKAYLDEMIKDLLWSKKAFNRQHPYTYPQCDSLTKGQKNFLSSHYHLLSTAYYFKGELEKSKENIKKALAIAIDESKILISIQIQQGFLSLEEGESEKAAAIFLSAKKRLQQIAIPGFGSLQECLIRMGFGLAQLNNGNPKLAIECLEKALQISPKNLIIAIRLFDAYLMNKQFKEADLLRMKYTCSEFNQATTCSYRLTEQNRPDSYVVIYIWNPKSNEDYGHAAVKVVKNKESFYFTWFPSGDNYENKAGIKRATPSSYGPSKKVANDNHAKKIIKMLFDSPPANFEDQIKYMTIRKSDKEELRRSATFKIIFYEGLDVDRMLEWWKELYSSNEEYNRGRYNCCDVVLHSLQYSLSRRISDIDKVKAHRMIPNKKLNQSLILNSYKWKVNQKNGTKAQTVYQYCFLLSQHVNKTSKKEMPPVIIRLNRWNKLSEKMLGSGLNKITKFDFNPVFFNPNFFTSDSKISLEDLYFYRLSEIYCWRNFGTEISSVGNGRFFPVMLSADKDSDAVEEKKLSQTRADTVLSDGLRYGEVGGYKKAIKCIKTAMQFYKKQNRINDEADAHYDLGLMHIKRGNMQAAVRPLMRAFEIYEDLNDEEGIALTKYYLSICYSRGKDKQPKRATIALEEALIYFQGQRNKNLIIAVAFELGDCHVAQSAFKEAINAYKQALQWCDSDLIKEENVQKLKYNIGFCYFKNNDFNKAIKYLDEAAKAYKNQLRDDKAEKAIELMRKGEALHKSAACYNKGKQPLVNPMNNMIFQLTQWLSLIELEESEYKSQRHFYGTEPYPIHYEEGDCLFASIAAFVPNETVMNLRKRATQHIEQDQQLKNSIITLINSEASETLRTKEGDKVIKSFQQYIMLMEKEQTWGTGIEIVALARSLQRPIGILTPSNQYDYIVEEEAYQDNEPIFLNYVGEIHYAPLSVPADKYSETILKTMREAIAIRNNEQQETSQSLILSSSGSSS